MVSRAVVRRRRCKTGPSVVMAKSNIVKRRCTVPTQPNLAFTMLIGDS